MKKQNKSIFIGMFLLIGLIGLVSANGLQISLPNSNQSISNLTMSKLSGSTTTVSLVVSNQEPISFYNINFLQTNIISTTPFNLSSGENKTIIATINTNSDYNGTINLQGYYKTNVGESNKTYPVNIYFNQQQNLDVCDLTLIKGDSVEWISHVPSDVTIHNVNANSDIYTIPANSNKTVQFNTPTDFKYTVNLLGMGFTKQCELNVQDTTGLVHSTNYDFSFPINLKITYKPTDIQTTFLTTNYTINANSNTQDIFQIKNNGTNIAKNIHLSGEWLTFDKNNFDLNPGSTLNIGYTINPLILSTNETNKTYSKEITISGNFNTIKKSILVYVPYEVINNGQVNATFDLKAFENMYYLVCQTHPSDPICSKSSTSINQSSTTVTFTADFVQALLQKYVQLSDQYQTTSKENIELKKSLNDSLNNVSTQIMGLNKSVIDVRKSSDTNASINSFAIFMAIFFSIILLVFVIWMMSKKRHSKGLKLEKREAP